MRAALADQFATLTRVAKAVWTPVQAALHFVSVDRRKRPGGGCYEILTPSVPTISPKASRKKYKKHPTVCKQDPDKFANIKSFADWGDKLIRKKAELSTRDFVRWRNANFPYTREIASRYVTIAQNRQLIADLGCTTMYSALKAVRDNDKGASESENSTSEG
jgi:hypothetical protein